MSFTYTQTQSNPAFGLLNLNSASLVLRTPSSNLIFTNDSSVNYQLGADASGLSANASITAPGFKFSTAGQNGKVVYTDSSGKMATTSGFTFDGTKLTVSNLTVSGTTTVVNTENLLIKDPIIQVGSSEIKGATGKDTGFILTTATGSNVAVGVSDSNHTFIIKRTDADASGSKLLFVNDTSEYINVRVYGNVIADSFVGDGSQLTGLVFTGDGGLLTNVRVDDAIHISNLQPTVETYYTSTAFTDAVNAASASTHTLDSICANSNVTVSTITANSFVTVGTFNNVYINGTVSSQAIAIGKDSNMGLHTVAIGEYTGHNAIGEGAIAIGYNAGKIGAGKSSIAIGYLAGGSYQTNDNSIILNASGGDLEALQSGFFVKPVRMVSPSSTTSNVMGYSSSNEIVDTGIVAGSINGATLQTVLTHGNVTTVTMELNNATTGLSVASNVAVGGILTVQGAIKSTTSLWAPSMATDTLAVNTVLGTNMNADKVTASNVVVGTMLNASAATILAKDLDVKNNLTVDGVTTVSILKFTSGGIDPQITSLVPTCDIVSTKVVIGASGVTYGSNTITGTNTITGFTITGLAPNAHLYLYVSGTITLGPISDTVNKYINPLANGSYSKILFHIFNIGGAGNFIDMTVVN